MEIEPFHLNEQEQFLGATTLECARLLVKQMPKIKEVTLRHYFYVPDKPSGPEELVSNLKRAEFLDGWTVEEMIKELQGGGTLLLTHGSEIMKTITGNFQCWICIRESRMKA